MIIKHGLLWAAARREEGPCPHWPDPVALAGPFLSTHLQGTRLPSLAGPNATSCCAKCWTVWCLIAEVSFTISHLGGEKGEKPGGQHPILQTYAKTSAAKHSIRGKPHLLMLMQLTPMKSQGTHFCGYRGPFALNSSSHPSAHSKMGKQLFTCAIIQIFAHDNFSLLLSGSFRITIATKWISTILLNKVFKQNPFWPVNTRKDWYNRAECIQTSLDWLAFAMASCVKRSWTKMRIAWGETFKDQSN